MSAVVSNGLPPAAPARRELSLKELSHIPGTDGWPVVGSTFSLLADPKGAVERRAAQYGRVYRTLAFGVRTVALLGPEANEFVLFDSTKLFSSMQGWNWLLERLFPRGLMLLDFDEHRLHRKALSVAFKSGPMKSYLESLNRGIARGVGGWKKGFPEILFYPAIKQLTLDLAAVSFLGAEIGSDFEQVRRAFVDMVAAIVSVVRRPIPGTQMARGVKGRAFMVDYFGRQIEARRASDGADIFTQLCKAKRIIPPVPSLPRRILRDSEFGGYKLPAGARISVNPLYTHHMPEIWPEPEKFDPLRFTEEASRSRHKFAFVPYGGGAHMCLGLHFAYMQAKCFAYHLFSSTSVSVANNYKPSWQLWPIPKPRDGLHVRLTPLD